MSSLRRLIKTDVVVGEHLHEIPPYGEQTDEPGIARAITLATETLSAGCTPNSTPRFMQSRASGMRYVSWLLAEEILDYRSPASSPVSANHARGGVTDGKPPV